MVGSVEERRPTYSSYLTAKSRSDHTRQVGDQPLGKTLPPKPAGALPRWKRTAYPSRPSEHVLVLRVPNREPLPFTGTDHELEALDAGGNGEE